jgi:transcriptional regulator with XRE-family HTH domain
MTPRTIKQLRNQLGLTQAEFFDRLGLTATNERAKRQTVNRWERGLRTPGPATIILLQQLKDDTRPLSQAALPPVS